MRNRTLPKVESGIELTVVNYPALPMNNIQLSRLNYRGKRYLCQVLFVDSSTSISAPNVYQGGCSRRNVRMPCVASTSEGVRRRGHGPAFVWYRTPMDNRAGSSSSPKRRVGTERMSGTDRSHVIGTSVGSISMVRDGLCYPHSCCGVKIKST